jgi:hypothetical protein
MTNPNGRRNYFPMSKLRGDLKEMLFEAAPIMAALRSAMVAVVTDVDGSLVRGEEDLASVPVLLED